MLTNRPSRPRPARENAFRAALRCFGLIRRVMHPYFEAFGISASQWGVLRVLHRAQVEGDDLRLMDLGQRLLVRPPSVTGVISRLERMKLVRRSVASDDQRARCVKLTDAGTRLVDHIMQGHSRQVRLVLRGLSPSEQKQLQNLLNRWSDHLQTIDADEQDVRVS